MLPLILAAAVLQPGVPEALRSGDPIDAVVMLADGVRADDVLERLPPGQFVVHRRYLLLPAVAGRARPAALEALARDPRVTSIGLDHRGHTSTAESGPAIGATQVRTQFGLTGKGVRVAVLDTGVDRGHPDLDGGVFATKCFVLGGCPPGNTDVGELAPEGSGHGTHVSGTITGDGRVAPMGIAPGADLLMIRVFDNVSYGRESDWAAALDWLLANNATLGVRVVNLSLGTDEVYDGGAACAAGQPLLAIAVEKLRDAGVISFAAAGNDGKPDAINSPACVPAAVAVGATYDADLGREPDTGSYLCGCSDADAGAGSVVCFSNSSPDVDLLAPGSRIRAAAPGGGVAEKRGTSQAAPHASGTAALMLELDPTLSPDDLEQILEVTGVPTTDAKNGRTTPRLDARAAILSVLGSYCSRRADGAVCPRTLACDGGSCAPGTCALGACVAALMPDAGRDAGTDAGTPDAGVDGGPAADAGTDVTLPALDGSYPGARAGCSVAFGGTALLLWLLAVALMRRTPTPFDG